jgi:hypothetical protein
MGKPTPKLITAIMLLTNLEARMFYSRQSGTFFIEVKNHDTQDVKEVCTFEGLSKDEDFSTFYNYVSHSFSRVVEPYHVSCSSLLYSLSFVSKRLRKIYQ